MSTLNTQNENKNFHATTQWEKQLLDLANNINSHRHKHLPSSNGNDDTNLRKAYQKAKQVTSKYSKSFYFASNLLPKEKKHAARALYAFCRTVDDIVDDANYGQDRTIGLNYWRDIVKTASPSTGDLVALAWADALTRYHIPHQYALQLIDGVASDLSEPHYQTFDELATYCYGVASTVGLMSMYIIGFKNNEALPYAIKLGVALQMTNILRDVGEDYRNGRLYLPRHELTQFGITEEEIAQGKVTEHWRAFMQFQIQRTRNLYQESSAGIPLLEKEGQLAIQAASSFYQGILDVIEKNDYDVFNKRASVSYWGKVKRLIKLLFTLIRQ